MQIYDIYMNAPNIKIENYSHRMYECLFAFLNKAHYVG